MTDNGGEFTDRYAVNSVLKKELNIEKNKPSGRHLFDQVCKENNIEHRLTRPYSPKTNGMIERFNRRINASLNERKNLAGSFKTLDDMIKFIKNVNEKYNETELQCLHYKSPLQMLKEYNTKEKIIENNFKGQNTQGEGD